MSENDLPYLLAVIERNLEWGSAANWQSRDFERLNILIFEKTKVSLSASTLRRIWGKVDYQYTPSTTTLDTLAMFADYESWREFVRNNKPGDILAIPKDKVAKDKPASSKIYLTVILTLLIVTIITYLGIRNSRRISFHNVEAQNYSFNSREITRDIPNSVVFTYDAVKAGKDSVFIQQSWDVARRSLVPASRHQFTSMYYRPGFYQAKLVVSGQVVKEHPLVIPTKGWLGLIAKKPVPLYLADQEFLFKDSLGTTAAVFQNKLSLQNFDEPFSEFYNVGNFAPVAMNDFTFALDLKNTYHDGTAKCQLVNVQLITNNQPLNIPLSAPGCISNLNLSNGQEDISGRSTDLSAFGTDLSQWTRVSCESQADSIAFLVNDKLVFKSKRPDKKIHILGIGVIFQGAGMIRHVRLSTAKKVVFTAY